MSISATLYIHEIKFINNNTLHVGKNVALGWLDIANGTGMAQENHDKMNRLAKGNSCHYDHSQKATAHYELLKVVFNVQEELHSQY